VREAASNNVVLLSSGWAPGSESALGQASNFRSLQATNWEPDGLMMLSID